MKLFLALLFLSKLAQANDCSSAKALVSKYTIYDSRGDLISNNHKIEELILGPAIKPQIFNIVNLKKISKCYSADKNLVVEVEYNVIGTITLDEFNNKKYKDILVNSLSKKPKLEKQLFKILDNKILNNTEMKSYLSTTFLRNNLDKTK